MKRILRLTEKDLSSLIKKVINENLEDRTDEMYSHINELLNMEYINVSIYDKIDVIENILQSLKSQSHREKRGLGHITSGQVKKRWSMNQ